MGPFGPTAHSVISCDSVPRGHGGRRSCHPTGAALPTSPGKSKAPQNRPDYPLSACRLVHYPAACGLTLQQLWTVPAGGLCVVVAATLVAWHSQGKLLNSPAGAFCKYTG